MRLITLSNLKHFGGGGGNTKMPILSTSRITGKLEGIHGILRILQNQWCRNYGLFKDNCHNTWFYSTV